MFYIYARYSSKLQLLFFCMLHVQEYTKKWGERNDFVVKNIFWRGFRYLLNIALLTSESELRRESESCRVLYGGSLWRACVRARGGPEVNSFK